MKPGSFNAALLAASLAFAGLQGCAARLEMGVPPRLDRLAQLTPHVSTRNDVLLTLGEPRGYGAAHLDPGFKQQRVWLYEHSVSEGKDIQLTMLLVFFSGESYDGYMWFADALNLKQYSAGKGK
ncbi:MAG: hypothetical protein H6R21_1338 [Proteobacteria bacterium]|nr:hypothetical protein [Pseudomonadota bacterium]